MPDSSWFTNRVSARPLSLEEFAGAERVRTAGPGPWTVVSGKSDGITPGFTIRDTANAIWFVKFDPPRTRRWPRAPRSSPPAVLGARLSRAREPRLAVLDPASLVVGPEATIRNRLGERRRLTRDDVERLLSQAARRPDRRYRVIASRALPGRPLGPFQ
ncbi:MAG: hypothetical protein R2708_05545 [Vicinamibacterales bacterium]